MFWSFKPYSKLASENHVWICVGHSYTEKEATASSWEILAFPACPSEGQGPSQCSVSYM